MIPAQARRDCPVAQPQRLLRKQRTFAVRTSREEAESLRSTRIERPGLGDGIAEPLMQVNEVAFESGLQFLPLPFPCACPPL